MATISFRIDTRTEPARIAGSVSDRGKRFVVYLESRIPAELWFQGSHKSGASTAKGNSLEASNARREMQKMRDLVEQITEKNEGIGLRRFKTLLTKEVAKMRAKVPNTDETAPRLPSNIEDTPITYHLMRFAEAKQGIDCYANIKKYQSCAKWVKKFTDATNFEDRVGSIDTNWLTEFARYILYGDHKRTYLNNLPKSLIGKIRATANEYDLPITVSLGKIMSRFTKGESIEGNDDMKYLTEDEVLAVHGVDCSVFGENAHLYEAVRDCFVFCCYTGLRHRELFFLRRSSVQERVVMKDGETIRYQALINNQTKSRRSNEVPLNNSCLYLIDKWSQRDFKVSFKPRNEKPIHNDDPLLPVHDNTITNTVLHELLKKAGGSFERTETKVRYSGSKRVEDQIPRWKLISFHAARHTYGCMLIEQGVDIYTVSKLMGHGTISTTEKYYAKVRKGSVALKALAALKTG